MHHLETNWGNAAFIRPTQSRVPFVNIYSLSQLYILAFSESSQVIVLFIRISKNMMIITKFINDKR